MNDRSYIDRVPNFLLRNKKFSSENLLLFYEKRKKKTLSQESGYLFLRNLLLTIFYEVKQSPHNRRIGMAAIPKRQHVLEKQHNLVCFAYGDVL